MYVDGLTEYVGVLVNCKADFCLRGIPTPLGAWH